MPSDGMRRWLTLELARHLGASSPGAGDGIAANVIRAYPGDLRSAVLAVDRPEDQPDPWRIERMVWPVLEAISEADHGTLPTGLAALEGQREGASLYAKGRRIADLFDRYHLHRPHMVRQWAQNHLVDGAGRPLDDHTVWQARLWRQIRARIDEPSPPERLPAVLQRLHAGEVLLDLPPRLVLFGFTLLPAGAFLDVARAVAASREVHVFMLEPTHFDPERLLLANPRPRRRYGPAAFERRHRVPGSITRCSAAGGVSTARPRCSWPTSRPRVCPCTGSNFRSRRRRGPTPSSAVCSTTSGPTASPSPPCPTTPADDSVQFHSCFGATRQVEVLRDALLHLLARPGTDLTEDDIVVLCPALDRFAPLIEAAFGRSAPATTTPPSDAASPSATAPEADRPGAPALRYRLADRSIRTTNPVLSAASALLQLVAGRFDADAVLEFLALGPVRERFGFDDDKPGGDRRVGGGHQRAVGSRPFPAGAAGPSRLGGDQHLGGGAWTACSSARPSSTRSSDCPSATSPRTGWRETTSRPSATWPRSWGA